MTDNSPNLGAEKGSEALDRISIDQRSGISPEVSAVGVTARLPKGGAAKDLGREILVLDTGQPAVPDVSRRNPQTQAELDELYRETIKTSGIIDHHSIDAAVVVQPGMVRHSSTGMAALAPELVLQQIDARGVAEITAHRDSDLDSLAACYLAQYLKTERTLPAAAKALAEHVDQVDFGLYRVAPESYVQSLAGVISALKRDHDDASRAESGSIWADAAISRDEKVKRSSEISARHQNELIHEAFQIFNGCEVEAQAGAFNPDNISRIVEHLPVELRERIERGQAMFGRDLAQFDVEHAAAERFTGSIVGLDGQVRQVPVVLFAETQLHPLLITNLSYTREAPETIVAVYAGRGRKGCDAYDIGIKPETAQAILNLDSLAAALSRKEGELRTAKVEALETKVQASTISPDEHNELAALKALMAAPLRPGFEHFGISDPTVCVAGGSLVAASTRSLMSADDFKATVRQTLEVRR